MNLLQFPGNFWWFIRHYRPFRIKWNSPRFSWRLAMNRHKIRAAVEESRRHA